MSLIWLFTRSGQVIDLDKVPYSTLDLVKTGTKNCMSSKELEDEENSNKANKFTYEMIAKGFIIPD